MPLWPMGFYCGKPLVLGLILLFIYTFTITGLKRQYGNMQGLCIMHCNTELKLLIFVDMMKIFRQIGVGILCKCFDSIMSLICNLALILWSCDWQDHNLDWFPRMRAMSLVSSDADGEQNEIRSLQEKLESTMKLVSNLSGQLTELKEQVCVERGRTRHWVCLCDACWPLDAPLTEC